MNHNMFARSVQPDIISLFSSTGSDSLGLFSLQVDASLPSDAFIHLLNDTTSLPAPPPPAALISPPAIYRDHDTDSNQGRELNQTVLHIQSPTLRNTFIQCPSSGKVLGLKHVWLHVQVRNLGRDWSFEVGIVDKVGRQGVIRCSTFQKSPTLVRNPGSFPLLHLPLAFPLSSSSPLTAWSTITLNLPKFIPHFASLARIQSSSDYADEQPHPPAERGAPSNQAPLPSGTYSHLAFIKIYATCRLRRVWLSESAPITRTPWEFELYGN